ncbi:MAG: OB-fold nucleic acid binding domain-containing protein, partial [Candidatus Thermoplasmatota archaeon]|nr:OB-fold nucleic acid binding domain-containing protein [Candidatus Thermoplasmatota archaeon]
MIPVEELKEGDSITSLYAVRQKETPRDYRNKEGKYFFFTVGDRTGNIKVKFWGGGEPERTLETYRSMSVGSVVEISGDVEYDRFGEELVIKMSEGLHFIRHCSESEYEPELFLPTSDKDLVELYKTLLARLDAMESEALKELLASFFRED